MKRRVNKVIYCLLALFLGNFGIHKFYAGHAFVGILYLIFSWTHIPGIIALFSFAFSLFRQTDIDGNFIDPV